MCSALSLPTVAVRRPEPMVVARQSALRGGSLIAICRALLYRALPGAVMGIGAIALLESSLSATAAENARGAALVWVYFAGSGQTEKTAKPAIGSSNAGLQRPEISQPRFGPVRKRTENAAGWGEERLEAARTIFSASAVVSMEFSAAPRSIEVPAFMPDSSFALPLIGSRTCSASEPGQCDGVSVADVLEPDAPSLLAASAGPAVKGSGGSSLPRVEAGAEAVLPGDAGSEVLLAGAYVPAWAEDLAIAGVPSEKGDFYLAAPERDKPGAPVPLDQEPLPFAPMPSASLPIITSGRQAFVSGPTTLPLSTGSGESPVGEGAAGTSTDAGVIDLADAALASQSEAAALSKLLSDPATFSPAMRGDAAVARVIASPAAGHAVTNATELDGAPVSDMAHNDAALSNAFAVPRLVQLRALIELFSDRFEAPELHRINASSAADTFVPVTRLAAAGIDLSDGFVATELVLGRPVSGLPTWQTVPTRIAPEGGNALAGGSGALGLKRSLVASASAGFDSNPFFGQGGSPEAASFRLQLTPTLARADERGTLRLSGRFEHIEYLGTYASLQNFGGDFGVSRKVTERLTVEGGLILRSDVLGTSLGDTVGNVDPGTGNPLPPTGNDVTILGQGQRRTQFGFDGGLTFDLSERDLLRWSVSGRADRFGSANLVDSNFLSQRLEYLRRLREDFTIGAAVDASLIDFTGAGLDGARTVSPQLQINAALTPRLTLTASAGVAITQLEFNGLKETTTALAGDASLCRKGERSSFCINGSRQVLPAAIGGALLQTTAGISYSLKLSERDSVQLSGSYGTASQPVSTGLGDFDSFNGSARYERQLNERMRLFVSGGALNTAGGQRTSATNLQGLIGITMDFGQTR